MVHSLGRFMRDDEGQSLVEYALLVALIAVVSITVLRELGAAVRNTFERSANSL